MKSIRCAALWDMLTLLVALLPKGQHRGPDTAQCLIATTTPAWPQTHIFISINAPGQSSVLQDLQSIFTLSYDPWFLEDTEHCFPCWKILDLYQSPYARVALLSSFLTLSQVLLLRLPTIGLKKHRPIIRCYRINTSHVAA